MKNPSHSFTLNIAIAQNSHCTETELRTLLTIHEEGPKKPSSINGEGIAMTTPHFEFVCQLERTEQNGESCQLKS